MSVHIGEEIKKRAKELRIGPTELAHLVNSSKQNIYSIYKRKSIDCDLLQRISIVLGFDFFNYYRLPKLGTDEKQPPAKYTTAADVDLLNNELQDCRRKYNLLKELYIMSEGDSQH